MARKLQVYSSEWIARKPKKQRTFTGKKYATRKKYRGQGR